MFISNAVYLEAVIIAALAVFFASLKREEKATLQMPLAAAAILTPLFAFFSPNLIVFHLFCFALIPAVCSTRVQVVPVFVFMMMTAPMISTEINAGGTFLIKYSIAHSIGLGALLALIVRGGWKRRPKPRWDAPFLTVVLLIWLYTSRDTAFSNYTRGAVFCLLSYVLPYLIVSRGVSRPIDIRLTLVGLAAAAVVLSMICVFETVKIWPIYRAIWTHYGLDLSAGAGVKLRSGLIRSPGPYPEPLTLSFALTICILALLAIKSSIRSRLHFIALCGIVGLGILAPQGRGAWLAIIAAILAADIFLGRWRSISVRASLLIVAFVALLSLSSVSTKIANIAGLTSEGRGTLDYRKDLLSRGMEEVWKNPILGDSPTNIAKKMVDLMQGEGIIDFVNAYLYTMLLSGFVGLAVLVAALLYQLSLLWSLRPTHATPPEIAASHTFAFSSVIAIAIMIGNIFLGGSTLLDFGIVAGIAAGTSSLARKGSASARRRESGNPMPASAG